MKMTRHQALQAIVKDLYVLTIKYKGSNSHHKQNCPEFLQGSYFENKRSSYLFMLIRNSSLLCVFLILLFTNSMASIGFISDRYFLRIHMRCMVFSSRSRSSL